MYICVPEAVCVLIHAYVFMNTTMFFMSVSMAYRK